MTQREGWFIYFGDVRVGHIGIRAGVPVDADRWGWSCGFHPGCDPGEQTHGSAKTFEEARTDFEAAWKRLEPKKTEAHFEMWRRSRDFHAWKERMWEERFMLPTLRTDGRSWCFCGAEITTASILEHIQEAHRGIGDPKAENQAGSQGRVLINRGMPFDVRYAPDSGAKADIAGLPRCAIKRHRAF